MAQIDVAVEASAPAERVWAILADARGWPEWTPFDEATLEREGSPQPDGVGAIRRFRLGKRITRECIVAFEPPHWLAYELLSGLPLRAYRADVMLNATPSGCTIRWQSAFEPLVPGTAWLIRRRLEPFVREVAERLARRATSPKGESGAN